MSTGGREKVVVAAHTGLASDVVIYYSQRVYGPISSEQHMTAEYVYWYACRALDTRYSACQLVDLLKPYGLGHELSLVIYERRSEVFIF